MTRSYRTRERINFIADDDVPDDGDDFLHDEDNYGVEDHGNNEFAHGDKLVDDTDRPFNPVSSNDKG